MLGANDSSEKGYRISVKIHEWDQNKYNPLCIFLALFICGLHSKFFLQVGLL